MNASRARLPSAETFLPPLVAGPSSRTITHEPSGAIRCDLDRPTATALAPEAFRFGGVQRAAADGSSRGQAASRRSRGGSSSRVPGVSDTRGSSVRFHAKRAR